MDKSSLNEELQLRKRLLNDFTFYAQKNLKITTKEGGVRPFIINKAQQYIHKKLEEQFSQRGYVRAIILKGRQQGCSTYIGGRYYHKTTHNKGRQAYIMAHNKETTQSLFEMSLRFYSNSSPFLQPSCSQNSQNRIVFDKLNSGYRIGTAGASQVGRGQTIHYAHGSEVAFWNKGNEISKGLIQAVPDIAGTEIILESTSDGKNNFFYQQWRAAERGEGRFIPIFVPWFWQDEYSDSSKRLENITSEEKELQGIYSLSESQLLWRRFKISAMASDGTDGEWAFKREYPNTSQEAFETRDSNSFIKDLHVTRARKSTVSVENRDKDLILGVDVARFGDDKTSMIFRQGNVAFGLKNYSHKNNMEVAGIIAATLEKYPQISKVYIDLGGGAGVVDRLHELGFYGAVVGINFGSSSSNSKYLNKRAEMWGDMRQWLADGNVKIPDDDLLHDDLICVNYSYHSDSKIRLEKKEDIKKRTGRSPDLSDALALTFANSFYDLSKFDVSSIL